MSSDSNITETLAGAAGSFLVAITNQAAIAETLDGATGNIVADNSAVASISETLEGVGGSLAGNTISNIGGADETLMGAVGAMVSEYDVNASRFTHVVVRGAQQQAKLNSDKSLSPVEQTNLTTLKTEGDLQQAANLNYKTCESKAQATQVHLKHSVDIEQGWMATLCADTPIQQMTQLFDNPFNTNVLMGTSYDVIGHSPYYSLFLIKTTFGVQQQDSANYIHSHSKYYTDDVQGGDDYTPTTSFAMGTLGDTTSNQFISGRIPESDIIRDVQPFTIAQQPDVPANQLIEVDGGYTNLVTTHSDYVIAQEIDVVSTQQMPPSFDAYNVVQFAIAQEPDVISEQVMFYPAYSTDAVTPSFDMLSPVNVASNQREEYNNPSPEPIVYGIVSEPNVASSQPNFTRTFVCDDFVMTNPAPSLTFTMSLSTQTESARPSTPPAIVFYDYDMQEWGAWSEFIVAPHTPTANGDYPMSDWGSFAALTQNIFGDPLGELRDYSPVENTLVPANYIYTPVSPRLELKPFTPILWGNWTPADRPGDYFPTLAEDFTILEWLGWTPAERAAVAADRENYLPTPVDDFTWNGTTSIVVDHSYLERSMVRGNHHSPIEEMTWQHRKFCSLIEETRPPVRGKSVWIDYPRPDPPVLPPSGDTITVPIQETYTMANVISVTLDDLVTEVPMDGVSISIDTDSFTWQFSGNLLDPTMVSSLKQLPDGTAIQIVVTVNGYEWHFLVEEVTHKRIFQSESVSISGRGLSALLTSPYRQVTSGTDLSTGLLNLQLADNLLPPGWTLNWTAANWLVPSGAFSYQNRTTLEAISDITVSAGAYIAPSRDSQVINVKSRYPVYPWDFDGAGAVDVAIPDSAIIELTYRNAAQEFPNGVYVHGGDIGGVLSLVRLTNTIGDKTMPTVSDNLITDITALRALGGRLLAGEYAQPDIQSIKIPMDGVIIPLIETGTFVGITVDGVETRGITNSVSVSVSDGAVFQVITIGEQTQNTWTTFNKLLPKDPTLVAVLSSTTGQSSVMTLHDGGVVTVTGTGSVGASYYIKSGAIQGVAPTQISGEQAV